MLEKRTTNFLKKFVQRKWLVYKEILNKTSSAFTFSPRLSVLSVSHYKVQITILLLSIGYPLNKTNPKYCLKNECPRKALRIWLHYSFQYLTNGQFHLGLCIKVVVVVVRNNREKAFDVELSQPNIPVPYKLSFQGNYWFPKGLFTLDAWGLVPGY